MHGGGHYRTMASRKPPAELSSAADLEEPTGSDESKSANSEQTSPQGTATPAQGNRFFSWMRELGIPRQPGWMGGVASGIGLRLGIDPIIVRGVIVVVAVLGGPALLLYAAAWLLLPDTEDHIHAEELGRGRFDPALIGIGIMALLSFLPLNQGFWWAGAAFWGDLSLGASVGRALWTALLLAGVVVLVIVIARRGKASTTVVPATTDDKPDTIPIPLPPAGQGTAATTVSATEGSGAPPDAPPAPDADAGEDELQAWKEQQSLWKQQHAEWKAQQTATERELRRQHALEVHEKALAVSAERVEQRRLRRLANPRISAATTAVALGAAILAGCVAALIASGNPGVGGHEATIALATAVIVLGLSIAAAGAFRRRSGALIFFSIVTILAMLVSAAVPRDRLVIAPGASWGIGGDARLAVPAGSIYLSVHEDSPSGETDVWQGTGSAELFVRDAASLRLELVSASGRVSIIDRDGRVRTVDDTVNGLRKVGDVWHWSTVIGPDPEPTKTLRLQQDDGHLLIVDDNLMPIDPLIDEPLITEGAE